MRARNRLAISVSVTALTTLVLLSTVVSSTATEAAPADVAHSACAKYADSDKQALCQHLIATLAGQQTGPAGTTVQPQHIYKRVPNDYQQHGEHQHKDDTNKEPWYHEAPEYQQQQTYYKKGVEEPYFSFQDTSSDDYHSDYSHGHSPPSVEFQSNVETTLFVNLTPKPGAVNATGKLTQNAFMEWSIFMYRQAQLFGPSFKESMFITQGFACKTPVVLEYGIAGTVKNPKSLSIQCNMSPDVGTVTVGAKFPWKEALKPRNAIIVRNPTQLSYLVQPSPGVPGDTFKFYEANVSSISSPVTFTGSIVELMIDVLLALPQNFAFSVAADGFADPLRGPTPPPNDRRIGPVDAWTKRGAPRFQCDRFTAAAEQLLCQQHADKMTGVDRRVSADSAAVQQQAAGIAAASPLYRREPQTPPAYNRDQGASSGPEEDAGNYYPSQPDYKVAVGDSYGPSKSAFLPDNYPKSDSGIAFIPQVQQSFHADVQPTALSINATGDLTQDDFADSSVIINVYALLSDKILYIDDTASYVDQTFECVPPVSWRFGGMVRGPFSLFDTIRIQCKMEAVSATVTAGIDFPWSAAERYKLQINQPQRGVYTVRFCWG